MSSNKYAGRKGRGRAARYADPFEKVSCYVPHSLMRELKRWSEKLGVPPERLIVRGCLNAVDSLDEPFNWDMTMSSVGQSTADMQRVVYQFICRADRGIDLDLLLMAWEEIGLMNDLHVRQAIVDLLYSGIVEMYNVSDRPIPRVRRKDLHDRLDNKERFRLFAGEKTDIDSRKLLKKKDKKGVL